MRHWRKEVILYLIGGAVYVLLEVLWRQRSHWTMFLLGGICFILLGLLNEVLPWTVPLWQQTLFGTLLITVLEFFTGVLVNRCFSWHVWDYSHLPGNVLGQICPQFTVLWIPISVAGILLDDWLRYLLFQEEKPHYKLI